MSKPDHDKVDKVAEFFDEHEISIYGFGPTDYGAEEGSLLWCIKELDGIYDRIEGTVPKDQILNVLCALIDIYENSSAEEKLRMERAQDE
jgi:hypothetical protein